MKTEFLRFVHRTQDSTRHSRTLRIESLSNRQMLAADLGTPPESNEVVPDLVKEPARRSFYFVRKEKFTQPAQLYRSTGTTKSTYRVLDTKRRAGGDPADLTFFKGRLYFTALLVDGQRELFVTDGTDAGTKTVRNLSGRVSSDPQNLTIAGDHLYFTALRPDGQRELFVTEGTKETTRLVHPISDRVSAEPSNLTASGNNLYFVAATFTGERELYFTDGTSEGTRRLTTTERTSRFSRPPTPGIEFNGLFYFTLSNSRSSAQALHVTDGTRAGTQPVLDESSGVNLRGSDELTIVGDRLLFRSLSRLMVIDRSDPLVAVPLRSSDSTNGFFSPLELTRVEDQLFFTAISTHLFTRQRELFVTDGTNQGTRLVRNLSARKSSDPSDLTAVGARLAFIATGLDGERELFRSNGTAQGTVILPGVFGTPTRFTASELTAVGNRLVFVVDSHVERRVPYLSDLSRRGTQPFMDRDRSRFDYRFDFTAADILRSSQPNLDTNGDGQVSAGDALAIVNRLSVDSTDQTLGEGEWAGVTQDDPIKLARFDVNEDGRITALDALMVINHLNHHPSLDRDVALGTSLRDSVFKSLAQDSRLDLSASSLF